MPAHRAQSLVRAFALVVALDGCAQRAVTAHVVAAPAPQPAIPMQSPAVATSEATQQASTAPPPAMKSLDIRIDREIEANVLAVAVEKTPHVLALGKDLLWIHDDRGWRSQPLPKSVVSHDDASLSLFFGRDYRARIVGSLGGPGGQRVYLRSKEKGLEPDRKEIGKLGADDETVVAVLGTADPEIVCRPGDTCLLKSVRGWRSIAAPAGIEQVALGEDTAWSIAGHQLFQLTDTWEPRGAEGTWGRVDALVGAHGGAYVIDTAENRLYFFDGATWHVVDSPIPRPHAMWSSDGRHFIVVGDGGLGTFDGTTWRVAAEAPHPLLAVAGRPSGPIYVGGPSGIFRVELRTPSE